MTDWVVGARSRMVLSVNYAFSNKMCYNQVSKQDEHELIVLLLLKVDVDGLLLWLLCWRARELR